MSRREAQGPKLLILGGGAVVRELYLPALQRLGWTDRVLIVEPSQDSVNALVEKYPGARLRVSDYRAPFEDDSAAAFDGAVIALPNQYHQDAATRALQRGLHVLCEKPLSLDPPASVELAPLATQGQAGLRIPILIYGLIISIMLFSALLKLKCEFSSVASTPTTFGTE